MNANEDSGVPRLPLLQVLICAFGKEGMERVASVFHPHVDGVEYLVSCQRYPSGERLPEVLARDDFRIIISDTTGLSVNRNIALSHASAPLILISDDDTDHTEEGLHDVIDSFALHPEADILTFRYASEHSRKHYPDYIYDLRRKQHFISSIEMAMRRASVQGKIWFNENFGVGALFPSGEEEVFLQDCIDAGLKCLYVPKTVARHDGSTTSDRNLMLASRPQTKGAVFLHLHPRDWPIRMITHAIREWPLWRKGLVPSPLSYGLNWLKGVRMAKKMKVYLTPDNSKPLF